MGDVVYIERFLADAIRNDIIQGNKAKKSILGNFYDEYRESSPYRSNFQKLLHEMYFFWLMEIPQDEEITFDESWMIYIMKLYDVATESIVVTEEKKSSKSESDEEKQYINEKECTLCNEKFTGTEDYTNHKTELSHDLRLRYVLKKLTSGSSHVLKIHEDGIEDVHVQSCIEESISRILRVDNISKDDYELQYIMQLNLANSDVKLNTIAHKNILLKPGGGIDLTLEAVFDNSIAFIYAFVLIMKEAHSNSVINVVKEITFTITSEFSDFDANGKLDKRQRRSFEEEEPATIIPGLKLPEFESEYVQKVQLKQYRMPDTIKLQLDKFAKQHFSAFTRSAHTRGTFKQIAAEVGIESTLKEYNYCSMLNYLLFLEEYQMDLDIKFYNTTATLGKEDVLYKLVVPGLAESRPSLIRGDTVFVKLRSSDHTKYQGIVHKIKQCEVLLGLNQRFDVEYIKNRKYFIEFTFNRRPLRVEHQSVELVQKHGIIKYFFPRIQMTIHLKNTSLFLFHKYLNEEQQRAVENIVFNPVPYIMFGPPGTGKTVTVVESILQIWKHTNKHILVCAPSNFAANEITCRLMKFVPSMDMFRLLGSICGWNTDELSQIAPVANLKNGQHYMPSIERMIRYRIVISTLITAARLVNGGLLDNHFSYVFIDESGYATESETLVPIAGILSNGKEVGTFTGQVILVGDPKQLGPRIHSPLARFCGFGKSMLERLMSTCKIYSRSVDADKGSYNPTYVTKLLKNYRSHKAILQVINKLFYDGELIAIGSEFSNVCTEWKHLLTPDFPVIFHHVNGTDKRDQDSPSFYNIQEIETVMSYIKKLVGTRMKGYSINANDIGVITPYRKQVQKLNLACRKLNYDNLRIGTVEEFQGREKLIIIISTVRSRFSTEIRKLDEIFELGFLKNAKRFNVALTRPKALLIVVGNQEYLKEDPNWGQFITYCRENNSITGVKLTQDTSRNHEPEKNLVDCDEHGGTDFSRGNI